jgi:hypothetical protein
VLLTSGRQHDDGNAGVQLAQPPAYLEPVEPGQHQVEQDQVGPSSRRGADRGVAVGDDLDAETGAFEVCRHDA